MSKTRKYQISYLFDGSPVKIKRNLKKVKEDYIYEKPCLYNGKFTTEIPRQDFYYSSYLMYEKNKFWTNLEKRVWKESIKLLIKEHGLNVNLSKYGILQSHFVYAKSKERVSKSVINSILKRTKEELNKAKTGI